MGLSRVISYQAKKLENALIKRLSLIYSNKNLKEEKGEIELWKKNYWKL